MRITKRFGKYAIRGLTVKHLELIEGLVSHVKDTDNAWSDAAHELADLLETCNATDYMIDVASKHKYLEEITNDPVILVS